MAWQKEFLTAKQWLGSRGWYFFVAQFTYLLVTSLIDFSPKALSVYPSFHWVMETGDGDCGVNCPAKAALPILAPFSCMFASPSTTCITFPQSPGPSLQGREV